ncbi:hypothetical protein ACNOYE_29340 [Nannocystaceae bacterium ST9]
MTTYHGGVRDGSPVHVSICSVLLGSLSIVGCRSDASPASSEQSDPPTAKLESAKAPEPATPSEASEPTPTPGPDHGERLADLDLLCRALDHDYVDGTLSDYYAKLEPATAWGRERLREGEESITPGRLLEAAATAIAADLDDPALAGCRKLFADLDDLE